MARVAVLEGKCRSSERLESSQHGGVGRCSPAALSSTSSLPPAAAGGAGGGGDGSVDVLGPDEWWDCEWSRNGQWQTGTRAGGARLRPGHVAAPRPV